MVAFRYSSLDYARNNEKITKIAYVYLPCGYDEKSNQKYNIFYLMHGWTENANKLFGIGNGMIKNMIDHMIDQGDIPPMILAPATFDRDNRS